MKYARPLPSNLVQRYHGWKATTHADNSAWYRRLAEEGQRPRAMFISCCDSRVNALSIFGAEQGEFFIHRNIANLVPPFNAGDGQRGTSATIEYAVTVLKVPHLIVMGHSNCGGVAGCLDMCEGHAPELEVETSFVGRWMDILRRGHDRVSSIEEKADRTRALEQQAVIVSLENLMTFPFIEAAVESGELSIHGLWTDIASGALDWYDPASGSFQHL